MLAIVGVIVYCGIQNSANAATEDVTFNNVSIGNGTKINVARDKSLIAINSGRSLFASATSNSVKGDAIQSTLDSFATSNYGDDVLFGKSVASNSSSISEAEIRTNKEFLPSVSNSYWLSDTGSKGSITWQGYVDKDNNTVQNTLSATGKVDDFEYDKTNLVTGSFAFNKDVVLEDYEIQVGGTWGLNNTKSGDFRMCYVDKAWFKNGTTVYNNPGCLNSGNDGYGNLYRSTTVQGLVSGSGKKAFAYVSGDNRIVQLTPGQTIKSGTVLVFGFMKVHNELTDPTGFLIPNKYYSTGAWASASYIGFIRTDVDLKVTAQSNEIQVLYGLMNYYPEITKVTARQIWGSSMAVRPKYDLNNSDIAFFRPATSNRSLTDFITFGNVPQTTTYNGNSLKAVVKSSDTTIKDSIADSSISTERNSQMAATYRDGIIKVPFRSKTLTLKPEAFITENANYITALADVNGTKKYTVLGSTTRNLNIDLSTIVNTGQVGSTATISFYAEQARVANTSNSISVTPVTVKVQVVEGPEQTITYNSGVGTGTVPQTGKAKIGESYAMASGSGLNKDGNSFSGWVISYTPFGTTTQTTQLIGGGETIVVPDTTNNRITATAVYSGISAEKSSDTSSTVITVTWDTNSPQGQTAKFASTVTGDFNSARTQKYDKINRINLSATVPGEPTDLSADFTYSFDGWYTDPVGGTEVTVAVTPTTNTTYYAHWSDVPRYTITYDAGDGQFEGGLTKITEKVTDSEPAQGPQLNESIATPVPNSDSEHMCFMGWYTEINGEEQELIPNNTVVGADLTYKAYYYNRTFMTVAGTDGTGVTDPRKTVKQGKATITLQDLVQVTESIKNGLDFDTTIFNATNDSYHLYTLLKSTDGSYVDPSDSNSWAEFRIIQVGEHDSDKTGLTFQMIHKLPQTYKYMASHASGLNLNWARSILRTNLQDGGEIFNMFDSNLTSQIVGVDRKYNGCAGDKLTEESISVTNDKFTILSYTEYQNNIVEGNSQGWTTGLTGSTYDFWGQFSIEDNQNSNIIALQNIGKARSQTESGSNGVFLRTGSTHAEYAVMSISDGILYSTTSRLPEYPFGVALSFSL